MLEEEVIDTILDDFWKLEELREKSVDVEKLSKVKSDNNFRHNKRNKVEVPLTKIPRPPPLFLHRMKKKAEYGKFGKSMDMLK